MLLIGSTALRFREGNNRPAQDIDLICTKEEFKGVLASLKSSREVIITAVSISKDNGFIKYKSLKNSADGTYILDCMFEGNDTEMQRSNKEVHANDKTMNRYMLNRCMLPKTRIPVNVASLEALLLLKESHKYKPGKSFEKTREQLRELREIDCVLNPEERQILERREKATYKKGYSLSKSKEEFFTDNVPYLYDHDSIHRAVAAYSIPMYMRYLKDGEQVQCDKKKWDKLPTIFKLLGVLEEVQVLALERAIIPCGTDPKTAFKIALEKVCTTITSGWFREFAYENYDLILKSYSEDFVNNFYRALKEGKILPYKGLQIANNVL